MPARQVADIPFARTSWQEAGLHVRVIAVRTLERTSGKQVQLWDDLDYTVKVYLTNDLECDGDWLARDYEGRAGIRSGRRVLLRVAMGSPLLRLLN